MNIYIFNHYAVSPQQPGITRHFDLAKQWTRQGHQVYIIASSFNCNTLRETNTYSGNDCHSFEKIDGVNFIWIKTPSYRGNSLRRLVNMLVYFVRADRIFRKLNFPQPNIVIGSVVHPFAPIVALRFARRSTAKFIYEIRDLWPQTLLDLGSLSKYHPLTYLFRFLEKIAVKAADGIVILSPHSKNYLVEQYSSDRIAYIPNGIDLERFDRLLHADSLSSKTYSKIKTISESKKILIFLGSIVSSNNLEVLVNFANEIKQFDQYFIALVGGGQDVSRIKALITQSGLQNIKVFDPVIQNEVPAIIDLAEASLLVQGKVMYGSMNKLFLYLAAKKPILCSLHAPHNNPYPLSGAGLLDTSLSDQFQKLRSGALSGAGLLGRRYVEQHCDIKNLAQKYLDFIGYQSNEYI